jgi:hypothetical protein
MREVIVGSIARELSCATTALMSKMAVRVPCGLICLILKIIEMVKSSVCISNNQLKVPTKDFQVRDEYNLHLHLRIQFKKDWDQFEVQENFAEHVHGKIFYHADKNT